MTTLIEVPLVEADNRGIRALNDHGDDTVLVWYETLVTDMGFDPATPPPAIPDFEPWDLVADGIHTQIIELAQAVAGDGADPSQVLDILFQEQCLAWYNARQGEADSQSDNDTDTAGPHGPERPAETEGVGAAVPGGSEDGEPLGETGSDPSRDHAGSSPQIPRRRRKRTARNPG